MSETETNVETASNTAVSDTSSVKSPVEFDRSKDLARLRKIGSMHFAAALAAVTLFGAGETWAANSSLALAQFVSVANALVAGVILAYMTHEWGHFSGARLSGAFSPVLKEPVSFFMFNFNFERSTTRQFIWMSLGGPVSNWLLVLFVLLLVPINTPGAAMLLATVIGVAISVCIFELPVIQRTLENGEAQAELSARVASDAGTMGRNVGILSGALLWLVMV